MNFVNSLAQPRAHNQQCLPPDSRRLCDFHVSAVNLDELLVDLQVLSLVQVLQDLCLPTGAGPLLQNRAQKLFDVLDLDADCSHGQV